MDKKFKLTTYSVNTFLQKCTELKLWGAALTEHVADVMGEIPSDSQKRAWIDCFTVLKHELAKVDNVSPDTYLVFEYVLARESGRRPDVLLLSGNTLWVLEFKQHDDYDIAQVDQVLAYARDLRVYHKESHHLDVKPVLILTGSTGLDKQEEKLRILSKDKISGLFQTALKEPFSNIETWFNSKYEPLPSFLESARYLFNQGFPEIEKARSAGIPDCLDSLNHIINDTDGSHKLILITGVPGAGKTLVGLRYVHQMQGATFLSGNGPLVEVLNKILSVENNGTPFVQGMHGFLKEYIGSQKEAPSENIIVFDEAQRAWNEDKVRNTRRGDVPKSEPEDLIAIGNRKEDFVIIALIGEGQEIHSGEESGIQLWKDAIDINDSEWAIYGPQKLQGQFNGKNRQISYEINEDLNLTHSLRTHVAETLQSCVFELLEGNLENAKSFAGALKGDDFPVYITRDLNEAKKYVRNRYDNELDKTFGLIASSKGKGGGVQNGYGQQASPAIYYVDKGNTQHCRELKGCMTEFGCQGLELDLPIICWNDDFWFDTKEKKWKAKELSKRIKEGGEWIERFKTPDDKEKGKVINYQFRKNSYRVLLTRGRDGMIIYISRELDDNTYALFESLGFESL